MPVAVSFVVPVLNEEASLPQLYEEVFQTADLMAERAGGDVELAGGERQAQMPRRGLEGPQGRQRWHGRMHEISSSVG